MNINAYLKNANSTPKGLSLENMNMLNLQKIKVHAPMTVNQQ